MRLCTHVLTSLCLGALAATLADLGLRHLHRPAQAELERVTGSSFSETGAYLVMCPDPFNCLGQGNCASRSCLRCPVVLNMQVASGGFFDIIQTTQQCPPGVQRGVCVTGPNGCMCDGPTFSNVPCGSYNEIILVDDQMG